MKGRKPHPFQVMTTKNDKNHLANNELNGRKKNEPKPNSSRMTCPSHLCDDAKKEWRRIIKIFKGMEGEVLTDLDVNALEIYCESLITYRKAMLKVRETAEVFASKTDPTRPRKNPWLTVANEAATQVKKYGEILCLDPVSRARVGLAKTKDQGAKSPMAAFLERKRAGGHET